MPFLNRNVLKNQLSGMWTGRKICCLHQWKATFSLLKPNRKLQISSNSWVGESLSWKISLASAGLELQSYQVPFFSTNDMNSNNNNNLTTQPLIETWSNISKSWGKSAGVGRHFICHRYWRGIKPRPTRNKPEFIENLWPELVKCGQLFYYS